MLDCPGNPRRDCDWPRLAEQWYDVRKPGWLRNLIHLARASCRVCGYRATALVLRCYGGRSLRRGVTRVLYWSDAPDLHA